MDFQKLHQRLIEHLRERVRRGEVTERGLAKVTGVSQPHLHNVLKGKRFFSLEMADAVLHGLHLDLLELLDTEELTRRRHP